MKILIHGVNFSPELTGIGKYTGEMAEWLAAQGHEVRVVTAPPYYPAWAVSESYSNWWARDIDCHIAGAPRNNGSLVVYRCPLWVPPQPGGAKRLMHLATFALSSLPVLLAQVFWRPQLMWVVEPALFCAPGALLMARLCGAKAWLHVQDFEVDAAFDLGLLRGKFLRGLVAGAERWLMRRFDVVSTISQRMHQRLLNKGVAPARAVLAPNWVDVSAIKPEGDGLPRCARNDGFKAELGIAPDAVVALYSGNMGGKQGLELLADVARLCQAGFASNTAVALMQSAQPAIVFVFCGNGAGRADLVQRCAGLSNVHFLDLQPIERLNELLALADIHLLPQRADAADLVMPSKLTGMLASARPVLATAHAGTELASVVQGCGVVVPPEDPPAMAQALLALAADAARREQMGAAGRAHALAHMDRDAVLRQFESALLAVTAKN